MVILTGVTGNSRAGGGSRGGEKRHLQSRSVSQPYIVRKGILWVRMVCWIVYKCLPLSLLRRSNHCSKTQVFTCHDLLTGSSLISYHNHARHSKHTGYDPQFSFTSGQTSKRFNQFHLFNLDPKTCLLSPQRVFAPIAVQLLLPRLCDHLGPQKPHLNRIPT